MTTIDPVVNPSDPRRYIGGTVVHHRKSKPRPDDYFSTDEESLRNAIRAVVGNTVLDPATVRLIRAKLAIQREQRIIPAGPDV